MNPQKCAKPYRPSVIGDKKFSRSLTDLATRIRNGFVESKNNRTKALMRQGYVYRNRHNLRLRILLAVASWISTNFPYWMESLTHVLRHIYTSNCISVILLVPHSSCCLSFREALAKELSKHEWEWETNGV